ncbi:hypothetical protein [Caballeronia sp. DA-9]|uniref:hypothetical protein n=1 Tax=Caballeronia sp. DA-9 TaxID=3436237 RepID=UPI003F6731CC
MNCKPGDLAYLSSDCVNEGVIVEVLSAGPLFEGDPTWHCKSRTPIFCEIRSSDGWVLKGTRYMTEICVADKHLRPISGVPVFDETPIETNLPEAVKLAWGIEAPVLP